MALSSADRPLAARFALLLAVLAAAAGCAAPRPGVDPRSADRYLEDLAARGIFQGAVVLGHAGEATYARAFGYANRERGLAFTLATPSEGGSIAKTFTAAAVLRLAEAGRIELEAPVSRYLPEYPHRETEVRHLIAHSAGLPDYDWFDRFVPPPATRTNARQLALLREQAQPPAFAPGSRFAYDNAAFDAAASLVERVSGRSFADFLREAFLAPLGMGDSFIRPARLADLPATRAIGYRSGSRGAERFDALEGEGFHGGGNLYLSAADLHRWVASFVTAPLLREPWLARGLEGLRFTGGGTSRLSLLGWYRPLDTHRHYYFGHHNGFYAFAYWDRARKVTVAMVSNSDVGGSMPTELPRALVALAEGRAPEGLPAVEAAEPAPGVLAGDWHIEGLGPVTIAPRDGRRFLRLADGLEIRLFRRGPGLYAAPGLDGWLRFHMKAGRPAVRFESVLAVGEGGRR